MIPNGTKEDASCARICTPALSRNVKRNFSFMYDALVLNISTHLERLWLPSFVYHLLELNIETSLLFELAVPFDFLS